LPAPAPPGGPHPGFPPPTAEDPSPGISSQQLQHILRAFWKHSLITFLGIVLVSAYEIRSMPKLYTATASLLVHHDTSGDPLVAQGAQLPPQGNLTDSFIPTQIELINSPNVLQPVIDRLDLGHDSEFTHGFKGTPGDLREVVRGNLQSALNVTQGKGSQVLYIAASYPTPNRAADIANAVATEYLRQEQLRVNEPASQRLALLERDVQDLRQKVSEAQEKVTEFRKQHGLIDVAPKEGGPDVETAALSELQTRLFDARNARRALEARQLNPEDSPEAVLKDQSIVALRAALGQDEKKLAQLLTILGPNHPEVMQLRAQISATTRSLENEVQAISRSIQTELVQARALEAKYQAAVEAQRATTVERLAVRDQAGQLELQLDSAKVSLQKALAIHDVVRFDKGTADVSLMASATPPARAEKPDKAKLFLMACMAAVALGLGWPFAYELLVDRRLRCRDDLEGTFGVPVLAQFGPIGVGSA
jgi:uncharacterized protein involved in exopolysaccharide biosynthesis